ncbi:MAG TPA: YceI family protein [Ktedonobacteraceae bacterium]|jgi:polyisoprenoid-binding protein YceI
MAWQIDASHSQVTFSVKHMMFATVKGSFQVISGQLHIDQENPANSSVDAQAETASIHTRDANRDAHLRSADFFDAEKYPTITFKSTSVERVKGDEYKVTGDLSIHGVTQSVVFDATYTGAGKDPWGNQRVGIDASSKINRKDFGLNWNQALEAGGVLVSEDVKIELELSLVEQK